jgi:uncharacterized protein YodC (DUF2158 family)
MNFKVGDLVMLKSGGPVMTVECKANEGMIGARWFIAHDLKTYNAWFPSDSIKKVDEIDPAWKHIHGAEQE